MNPHKSTSFHLKIAAGHAPLCHVPLPESSALCAEDHYHFLYHARGVLDALGLLVPQLLTLSFQKLGIQSVRLSHRHSVQTYICMILYFFNIWYDLIWSYNILSRSLGLMQFSFAKVHFRSGTDQSYETCGLSRSIWPRTLSWQTRRRRLGQDAINLDFGCVNPGGDQAFLWF